MPFKSVAQQHFLEAHPDKVGKAKLKEWEGATNFSSLPKKVGKSSKWMKNGK